MTKRMNGKIIPFRPRCPDRELDIALAIFELVRADLDAPSAIIERCPGLTSRELFDAFSRAHHVLNNLQRVLLDELKLGDGGVA